MHINKFLASRTGMSRRAADEEIKKKRVSINGEIAMPPDRVSENDKVLWKGKPLPLAKATVTIMLNKPVGYITSRKGDETHAPTVMQLLPKELQHLRPVGRLDKESEGLLLLTDDGDMLYKSTHPKFQTKKVYEVEFEEYASETMFRGWQKGVRLSEGILKVDTVKRLSRKKVEVSIHQGANRQLRRMAGNFGAKIVRLVRVASGEHRLENLKPGKWKYIR